MNYREVFILLSTTLALVACSSKGSGNGGKSQKFDFRASEAMVGHFVSEQSLNQNQPEAEVELESWKNECENVDGYQLGSSFKVGLKVTSREDEIHLWPKLKSEGDVKIYQNVIEKINSSKEFISVGDQTDQNFSIKGRTRHHAGLGSYGSDLLEIISTNPPNLKRWIEKEIQSGGDDSDENFVRCKSDLPADDTEKQVTTRATLVLGDGTEVRGILVTERREQINYVCGLYKKDETLIREMKMADHIAIERINFYSKELVNPFESKCHDSSGLLEIETIRDLSGGRGVIELRKMEVLSIK